jgi:hypothetical protein
MFELTVTVLSITGLIVSVAIGASLALWFAALLLWATLNQLAKWTVGVRAVVSYWRYRKEFRTWLDKTWPEGGK